MPLVNAICSHAPRYSITIYVNSFLPAFTMACEITFDGMTSSDSTNLPSIVSSIAARRHSVLGHIRRLTDHTPAHMTLKLAVNTRSGDTPHHGWNRPAGRPRTTWMSRIVPDSAGLSADDAEGRSTRRVLRPTAGYTQQRVSEIT